MSVEVISRISHPKEDARVFDAELGSRKMSENHIDLYSIGSHRSTPEVVSSINQFTEVDAVQYERFSGSKKIVITAVLSFTSFLAPLSSTAILAAIPEVAATYNTTDTIIDITNALYLVSMGLAPCFWGPISQVYGRRWIFVISAVCYVAMSIGTALAPTLAAFIVFRMLTAFNGASFLVVGTACIGDIYTPTERGSALGWFLSGTLTGPCLAPLLGGVIVTFTSWRNIFWTQTGIGGLATVLIFFLVPETIPLKKNAGIKELPRRKRIERIASLVNPLRVVTMLFSYPNLLIVGLASSALTFNEYALLTPIRAVLDPRFSLTSPLQSGLFFIAPGSGYLAGTFFGGRLSDWYVKRYIAKKGIRVSEDRLRTVLVFMGVAIPACMVLYGWSVEKRFGGIPLPVIVMFLQGFAQLFCFPGLNTYCVDVMQDKGQDGLVVAGNYMIRFTFAALGSAVSLPAIKAIGVGWFSTISASFLIVGALLVWSVCIWGEKWRKAVDSRKSKIQRAEVYT